jgi:hypothetical protein
MTAHRLGSVVCALCLLVAVPPANAQCAWVLWGQTVDPWNALVALPLGAWTSRDDCEAERRNREQVPEELRMARYTCLPDTIDPRKPSSS